MSRGHFAIAVSKASQKRRLVVEVALLCRQLSRPVCRTDLHLHFAQFPERRPVLMQRLGLQLAKAAQPYPRPIRRLHKVGVWQAKAYYAPQKSDRWMLRFHQHVARQKAANLLRLQIVDHATYLLATPHDAMARHALSGLIKEIDSICRVLPDTESLYSRLIEARNDAMSCGPGPFVKWAPARLIPKADAREFLQREASRRRAQETPLSLFRYFARWRWPQSDLYPPIRSSVFCAEQLNFLVQSKWPMDNENSLLASALLACGRYGYQAPAE